MKRLPNAGDGDLEPRLRAWPLLFLLPLLFWFPAVASDAQTVDQAVQNAMATQPFDHALWMVLVQDEAGTVIAARNAEKLAIPASTRKLFVSATALTCLGPDARLQTVLWRDGDDLVLSGDGDPSLGSERYGYTPDSTFAPFVAALRARGIRQVHDIVADVSLFDAETLPGGWKIGNIISSYAAPVDALAFDENAVDDYSIPSPPLYAATLFRDVLQRSGIAVRGAIRINRERRIWREKLATIESPFVEELVATMLKVSQNLYAEMLFKRASAGDKPGSYDASVALEKEFLANEAGILDAESRFVDGCGLAPDDLVTPTAVVKLLRWMNHPLRRPLYWALLAAPQAQGTLRLRLEGLEDRMRGKTGSVNGVNSLAAILRGRNGGYRYAFVAINHHTGSSRNAIALIDSIIRAAADF